MDGLGIERPHTVRIGGEMPQRRISDDIEGFTGRHFRMKLDGLCTDRRLVIAVRQPIPALGFGSQIELAAGSTLAVSGQSEEVGRPTPLEFEFELRDRAVAPRPADTSPRSTANSTSLDPTRMGRVTRWTDVVKTGFSLLRDFLVVIEETGVFFVFRRSGVARSIFSSHSLRAKPPTAAVFTVWTYSSPVLRTRSVSP
jgi:hypothetical protein